MFIDEINRDTCWKLWAKLQNEPVKTARKIFPWRQEGYVKVAGQVKNYLANKGTALGLPGKREKERRDVYIKIAANIYCDIPAWGRSINTDFLLKEER